MLLEDAGQAGFGKGCEGKVDDGERQSVGITWIAAYGRLLLPDGGNRGCCRCFFARSTWPPEWVGADATTPLVAADRQEGSPHRVGDRWPQRLVQARWQVVSIFTSLARTDCMNTCSSGCRSGRAPFLTRHLSCWQGDQGEARGQVPCRQGSRQEGRGCHQGPPLLSCRGRPQAFHQVKYHSRTQPINAGPSQPRDLNADAASAAADQCGTLEKGRRLAQGIVVVARVG